MLKVGDLVQMKSGIQPPHLYGVGTVVKVLMLGEDTGPLRVAVHWSKQKRVGDCAAYALEVISESR